MLLGLRTSIHPVADLDAAKRWFTTVVGHDPYFDEPFYVGFEVGGYELGLLPDADAADGVQTYWGVENADRAVSELLEAGAHPHLPVTDVGGGIRTAMVRTPAGTLLGVIENPHFELPAG
jgi:predicted enzyme related to lactoylglutathione lyase